MTVRNIVDSIERTIVDAGPDGPIELGVADRTTWHADGGKTTLYFAVDRNGYYTNRVWRREIVRADGMTETRTFSPPLRESELPES